MAVMSSDDQAMTRVRSTRGERAGSGKAAWVYGRWAQAPVQRRSQRSFVRFMDAAEGLLATRHWHEVSVQQIVRRADASVGSFYNRFADKMALLHCLDDRIGEECERTIMGLIDELERTPALLSGAPGIAISLFMRLCTDKGGVIRALDITRKTVPTSQRASTSVSTSASSSVGLGDRFDHAVDELAAYLGARCERCREAGANAAARALRESFWLARERLVYGGPVADVDALHRMLVGHFFASLDAQA